MDVNQMAWRHAPVSKAVVRGVKRVLPVLEGALRLSVFAVLAALRPFIVIALTAWTVVGLLLCLFWGLLVHGSHFPMLFVLASSVVSAVLIVVYYAVMDLLIPSA